MKEYRTPDKQPRRRAKRGAGPLLREEILVAATDLLIRTRNEDVVSVRSVAERAGVTPPASYLHFADKTDLMHSVCARQLERLGDALRQIANDHTSSLDTIRAQALAYVRWAVEHAEIYRIATMAAAQPGNPVDEALTTHVAAPLSDAIQALIGDDTYHQEDPMAVAFELWASIHGVAAMFVARPYCAWNGIEEFADRVITGVCRGRLIDSAWGPQPTETGPS